MNIPQELKYTESHEWLRLEHDGSVTIGITQYAQEALGDIVFVELPEVGKNIVAKEDCAVVESVKAASDIYAPIAGVVLAINEKLSATPELINQEPYDAWLFKLQPAQDANYTGLIDASTYRKNISEA